MHRPLLPTLIKALVGMHEATTGLMVAAEGLWIILNDFQKQSDKQHQKNVNIVRRLQHCKARYNLKMNNGIQHDSLPSYVKGK
jgi:hypothetical protein